MPVVVSLVPKVDHEMWIGEHQWDSIMVTDNLGVAWSVFLPVGVFKSDRAPQIVFDREAAAQRVARPLRLLR